MNSSKILFWNVDTQIDFVLPSGKLYVPGAELLQATWEKITQMAKDNSIRVVNTADFHYSNSKELSDTPNFINTFPPHCMANTEGAKFVPATSPDKPIVIDWDKQYSINKKVLMENQNIVIRKDAFDVFKGNPVTDSIVKELAPKVVVVYGVTTNVCVNDAVVGLSERVDKVIVIEDAIKELPNIPLPFENWKNLGVEMIKLNDLYEMFFQTKK